MLDPDQPVFMVAEAEVEVLEVANGTLAETPYGPWGSLYDSSNILRMCLEEDHPDGISISSK